MYWCNRVCVCQRGIQQSTYYIQCNKLGTVFQKNILEKNQIKLEKNPFRKIKTPPRLYKGTNTCCVSKS